MKHLKEDDDGDDDEEERIRIRKMLKEKRKTKNKQRNKQNKKTWKPRFLRNPFSVPPLQRQFSRDLLCSETRHRGGRARLRKG